jgi:D-alanyl-D-alanine carboxypeptidase/D-alanyl-D-alanine-endopeptidase (penicillin-binding protein 4)
LTNLFFTRRWRLLDITTALAVVLLLAASAQSADTKPAPAKKPAAATTADKKKSSDSSASKSKSAKPKRPKQGAGKASPAPAITTNTAETLPAAIERVIAAARQASRWGIKVVELETGQPVFALNAGQRFIPASNRKLFTGALALDQLGPDFTYRTYLYHTGSVAPDGTLTGNLVIRPQGDPTFSNRLVRDAKVPADWIYRDWVAKAQAANIKAVTGELIVDCSDWDLGDLHPKGWSANIMQDDYAPQTSPLTLNDNLLQMIAKPGSSGSPAIIEFNPAARGFPVLNSSVTKPGKSSLSVRRNREGRIEVSGRISPDASSIVLGEIPCDNPTLYAAAVFRQHLHQAGIMVQGNLRVLSRKNALPPPTTENVIAVYISPPMVEVVRTMMKHSNNHFAEQIYVSVSAIKKGAGGYRASKTIENEFLQRAGIDPATVNFEDGSGLSRMNMVSPDAVCALLKHMSTHPASQQFFDSLAIGGQDGTLRGRLRSENTIARVHAKTGFINSVICLSGYLDSKLQKKLIFSFLVNDIKTSTNVIKSAQDRLCELLTLLVL